MSYSVFAPQPPGWASGPSGWIANPPSLTKALGWQPNQAPPSAYQNWFQNLCYQWLQYQKWENELDVIIDDDFNYLANQAGGLGVNLFSTGINGVWTFGGQTQVVLLNSLATLPMRGAVSWFGPTNAAGLMALNAPAAQPPVATSWGDFKMRFGAQVNFSNNFPTLATGLALYMGYAVQFSPAQTIPPAPYLGFVSTGPSLLWQLSYMPSGQGSTQVSLGVFGNGQSSGYSRFNLERFGATMVASINESQVAIVSPAILGAATGSPQFSVIYYFASGISGFVTPQVNNWPVLNVDWVQLKTRRQPYD